MQAGLPHKGSERTILGRRAWATLLLCTTLGACQAPSSTASTEAPASPTAQAAAAAPAAHESSRYPDASYTDGRLRPAYGWCVDGVEDAGQLQACGKDELAYQQARLQDGTGKVVAGLDAAAKRGFLATEATWRSDTDRYCAAPATAAVDDLQKAQECRLFRVANRADALLAQSGPPDTSYTQAQLRPEYSHCVQDARGMDDRIEACDAAEFAFQQKQMQAEVTRLMDAPDSPAKDRWMEDQARWAEDTDQRCGAASDHIGPKLDAQACRINRYANRAAQLRSRQPADVDDDDFPAPRPDDSYNTAALRPQYSTCVKASGGATPALQACGDEELRYQEDRLAKIVAKKVASPDSKAKDDWMEAQAAWWSDTDRYCTWDPRTEGQGQMLEAQSCRINRVANRADQLNASTGQP